MKIISSFHDYYDSALAFGSDERSRFVREPSMAVLPEDVAMSVQESVKSAIRSRAFQYSAHGRAASFEFSPRDAKPDTSLNAKILRANVSISWVVVAGQVFPIYSSHETTAGNHVGNSASAGPEAYVNLDRLKSALVRYGEEHHGRLIGGSHLFVQQMERVKPRWEATTEALSKVKWEDVHLSLGSPVLHLLPLPPGKAQRFQASWDVLSAFPERHEVDQFLRTLPEGEYSRSSQTPFLVRVNPKLKSLDLAAVLEPSLAFQAIDQFITGVAPGATMPMVQLDDKSMVKKKGFDPVYGFRKRPAGA